MNEEKKKEIGEVLQFKVEGRNKNKYSSDEETKEQDRIVQIKIFDILFNEQACNLVYLRDITTILEQNRQRKMLKASRYDHAIKFLAEPTHFMTNLTDYLCGQLRESQISKLKDGFVDLKNAIDLLVKDVNEIQGRSARIKQPINLRELVKSIADKTYREQQVERSIDFRTEVSSLTPIQVLGDKEKLEVVLSNLLSLAASQSAPGDTVRINCEIEDRPEKELLNFIVRWKRQPQMERNSSQSKLLQILALDTNESQLKQAKLTAKELDGEIQVEVEQDFYGGFSDAVFKIDLCRTKKPLAR